MGSASDTEPEALAIAGDVILVTINYRLNLFGFLATDDDDAPGNVAMLDQVKLTNIFVFLIKLIDIVCLNSLEEFPNHKN